MQRFKTKSILINVIVIAVLAVSLITGGILIGTKYNTTNEMSNEPAKAALSYYSSSSKTQSTNSYGTQCLNIYIYYDSAIYTSVSVSTSTITSKGGSMADFTWTGEFTASLQSGYSWTSTRKKVTYGWSRDKSNSTAARNAAYEDANSAGADTASVSVNGTNITLKSIVANGCGTGNTNADYAAIVVIFQTWYTVTGSIENPDTSIATVSPTSFNYPVNATSADDISFQGIGNGEIVGVKINGTSITIKASDPGSYTAMTGCEYRCYRSDKYVYVYVRKVTSNISITATHNAIVVSASLTSADSNKATLDKTSGSCMANSGAQLTFTYTAQPNYYINTIKINGNNITISETAPASFSSTTGTQYKCYRSANKVIVIVTNLTKSTTIVGTYATLWSVTSNDPTLVLQDTTTTRANWFTSYAKIVAKYEQNQNIRLCLDGVYIKLVGADGNGQITVPTGIVVYSYSAYNNYISIELNDLPNGPHSASIDHYTGASSPINVSVTGGSALQTVRILDNDINRVIIQPDASDYYVYDFNIDGVNVPVEYYTAQVYGVGDAVSIQYTAKDTTNSFVVEIYGLYGPMNLQFNLANLPPSLKVPPSSGGASVTGTVVTASVGGEARIVGNNIANGQATDTVTVIAVAYSGYNFAGWVYADDENEILSTSTSANFTKEQVDGKIIKALFTPKTSGTNSPNGQTNNTDEIGW